MTPTTPQTSSSPHAARLLKLRALSATRRLSAQGGWIRAALFVLLPAALWAAWWAMDALAAGVIGAGAESEKLLREHVFWLNAGPVLIWSYTTFEVVFRARDAMYLNTLPIAGAARSVDVIARTYAVHLPLIVPSALYALALALRGSPDIGAYAGLVALLTLLTTIPAATAIHLAAGRSLLSDAKAVRQLMAGQIVASEEAMLLWSPAGGLVVGLLLVVMYDLLLFHSLVMERTDLAPYAWVLAAVTLVVALRAVHRAVVEAFFGIIARFAQAEMPPPYTDEGVPETTRGEGLASLLPPRARPYFLRDRRQLRRRYRIDTAVVVMFGGFALNIALGARGSTMDLALAAQLLNALAATVGLLLVSAFRFRGELASPHLDVALPVDRRAERNARWLASAPEPLACVVLASAAAAIGGAFLGAIWVLIGGLLVVGVELVATEGLASRVSPHRAAWAGASWRALVLAVTAIGMSVNWAELIGGNS